MNYQLEVGEMRRKSVLALFMVSVLLLVNITDIAATSKNDINHKRDEMHAIPWKTLIIAHQIDEESVDVSIIAVYENLTAMLLINETIVNNNNVTIKVDSIVTGNATNFTHAYAHTVVGNLSRGLCSIEIIENYYNIVLANTTLNIEIYGVFLNDNEFVGTLGTFMGKKENDTLYMSPFPFVPTVPPMLFNYTAFWVNSTSSIFLAINLTNIGENKSNVTFSLLSNNPNISIHPTTCNIGNFSKNSYAVLLYAINVTGLPHGIYYIQYNLTYTGSNGTMHTTVGEIPVGVYELRQKWIEAEDWKNSSVECFLITPFGDFVNGTFANWSSLPIINGSVFSSNNATYSISYSNYTLGRNSRIGPLGAAVIGAVAGAVICGGATIIASVIEGREIDIGEVIKNAAMGAVGGALIGATFGIASSAALPMATAAKGMAISGGISGAIDAGLEAADQMITTGRVYSWGRVIVSGITGCISGAGIKGATYSAAFTHIKEGIDAGKYTSGPWLKYVREPWENGRYKKAIEGFMRLALPHTKVKRLYRVGKPTKLLNKLYLAYKGSSLVYKAYNRFIDEGNVEVLYEYPFLANAFTETIGSKDDSDGDGVSNLDELLQGTNPFDSSDGPVKIDILLPTSSKPAIVGDPSNPISFVATVATSYPILNPEFSAKIDGKSANVILLSSNPTLTLYTMRIFPPTQSSEGLYDLEISVSINGEIKDTDTETNAIKYSSGENIDMVIIIDRSGSMSGSKIQAAKDSACLFVDLMNINDMIGVVSYSSSASVNYPLTEITSDTIKQAAKNAINSISAGGWTSIGAGLQAGYNQLVNNGNPSHPWAMLLMSDGWHNTPPHPDEILPYIQAANIRVFTVGLGSGADAQLLSHIAHDSGGGGGEYYFSPGPEELSAIYNAIAGFVKAESIIKTIENTVSPGEVVTHEIYIDSTVKKATFTVTWSSGSLDLELIRPDGSYVNPSDPDVVSHIEESTYETYTIANPTNGYWIMEITGIREEQINDTPNDPDCYSTETNINQSTHITSGISYTATVTGITNITVTLDTDKDNYYLNEPIKIFATLTKNGKPIVGANITATIEKPNSQLIYLTLFDDGKHGDGKAFDGVYSNNYIDTSISGSYILKVYAVGVVDNETFRRELTKSVYVKDIIAGEITVSPSSIDLGLIRAGEYKFLSFNITSSFTQNLGIELSSTDMSNNVGDIIGIDNITLLTNRFIIPPYTSCRIYGRLYIPKTAKDGDYNGAIIIRSNVSSITIPINFSVLADQIPPTTTKTIGSPQYENGTWIISSTPINLTAYDNESGVNATYYRIWYNGTWSNWTLYTGNFTLQGECKHYLEYYSIDNAGNVENITNQTHYVDDSPPVSNIAFGTPYYETGGNIWITTSTPIYLSAVDYPDCACGVMATYYRINGGVWQEYIGPFTINEECQHTIEYYSIDYLGNEEEHHVITVNVDSSPPETTLQYGEPYYSNGVEEWITTFTPIYLNASDEPECACGVKEIHYSYDGGNTWHVVNGSNAVFTIPDECEHEILYYAVDYLGNAESVKSVIVNVDNSPPETTIEFGEPYVHDENHWVTSSTFIYINSTDQPYCKCGVSKIYYRIWNGSWSDWYESNTNITFRIEEECKHYIEYYAVDNIGNVEQINNITVYVDNTPPISNIRWDGYGNYASPTSTFIITAFDEGCSGGVGNITIYWKINGGETNSRNADFATFQIQQEGVYTIEYWAVDGLGNEEEHKIVGVVIDASPPHTQIVFTPEGIYEDGKWYILTSTKISFNAIDECGVKLTKYRINNSSWMIYDQPFNLSAGIYSIDFFSVDNLNNYENAKTAYIIVTEDLAPITICNIEGNENNGWYNSNVTISFSTHDKDGVKETYYKINDGRWKKYRHPIEINEEGIYYLKYYSVDVYGLKEKEKNTIIKIDKGIEMEIEKPLNALYIFDKKILPLKKAIIIGHITVKARINEDLSGIETAYIKINDKIVKESHKNEITYTFNGFGKYEIIIYARDKAGNEAIRKMSVLFL